MKWVVEPCEIHAITKTLNEGKEGYEVFQVLVRNGSYQSQFFQIIWVATQSGTVDG